MTALQLPSAVLWDMDGTLIDTEPFWFAAETELVGRFGGTWTHDQAISLVGSGLRDGARVLQDHGVRMEVDDIVAWQTDFVTERLVGDLPWRPGALELLAALRDSGVPTALVTMSVRRMAVAVAAALPIGGFDVVVAGDDVARPKPDPEAYLRAAELLGVDVTRCVAIEDSPPGLAAAIASGAATVGVPHQAVLPDPDLERAPARWRIWRTLEGSTPQDLAAVADELARA
ncbi:HAD family hydrolase [Amnibacterium kyonggiense]|uniref:HAD superfamily hydrolase (TIGR01509 family) n=1 Tax=Amnibacterium kyonggiense TaxID=595671 RepID=A0A4R7FL40_9MICO|nr:HAD family phosphatase [Amnibacterium kyonggiense]TDS77079.1 HAD superfamily hydrolase (TIGR01509 family) [Amnibacterium kyonggiense]